MTAPVVAVAAQDRAELQPGDLAPPHGFSSWLQKDGDPVRLAELRGSVVVIHTFAWNCSACKRVGVPLAVDLEAVRASGMTPRLRVLSVTTPARRKETKDFIESAGVTHPVAMESPLRSSSPYINPSNPLTFVYVIGRSGEIVWMGDPSRDEDGCSEAIIRALGGSASRRLEIELPVPGLLRPAVRDYFSGRVQRALRVSGKAARSSDEKVRVWARALQAGIERASDRVFEEFYEAVEGAQAGNVLVAWKQLQALKNDVRFSAAKEAFAAFCRADSAAIKRAREWIAISIRRPARFPASPNSRYESSLKAFVKKHDRWFVGKMARSWLSAARLMRGKSKRGEGGRR